MLDRRSFLSAGGAGLLLPSMAWAGGNAPIVSNIALEQQRLWIAASISGGKPYLFVIDTGAGFAYIRPDIARSLNLPVTNRQTIGGLGKDQVVSAIYMAHDVVFGGKIRQPVVAFAGYDFGRGIPDDAAGLLASGLVTARDSDLDFEANEWRVWPRGRPDRDGLAKLDSLILGYGNADRFSERILVTAMINGAPYRLHVDTGAPTNIVLFPQAAKRSGLFADNVPFAPAATAGFGGQAGRLSRRVRASRFEMGPLMLDRPLVTVMDPRQAAKIDHDGLIGLPLIGLLTLSTDVMAKRLWIGRNSRAPGPDEYRLAGLWLDRLPSGGARVAVVGGGSPAERSGVKEGDEVASPPTFEEAIRHIGGPVGHEVVLGLRRSGHAIEARYTLQAYL